MRRETRSSHSSGAPLLFSRAASVGRQYAGCRPALDACAQQPHRSVSGAGPQKPHSSHTISRFPRACARGKRGRRGSAERRQRTSRTGSGRRRAPPRAEPPRGAERARAARAAGTGTGELPRERAGDEPRDALPSWRSTSWSRRRTRLCSTCSSSSRSTRASAGAALPSAVRGGGAAA